VAQGPESKIQSKIIKFIKMMSIPYVKMTGYGKQGWPDITMCIGGRMVVIEVKAVGKKPDAQQMTRRKEILGQHGVWLCYDDAKNAINAIAVLINLPWTAPIDYSTLPPSIKGKEAINVNI
jgi:hypothetical protein